MADQAASAGPESTDLETGAAYDDGSETGEVGHHPEMNYHVHVAPTPAGEDTYNAVRPSLMTVACWRLDDARFEFDSSFLLPQARNELRRLASLREQYPDAPLSIFGHADPVGDDEYNKKLSGARAEAIYGVLARNTAIWERHHNDHEWGLKSTQQILQHLGYYSDPCDGVTRASSTQAIKDFQHDHDLKQDGDPGPKTRKELYKTYMDSICVDRHGRPYQLEPKEFVGKGADARGKGDYQGCGEFNPVLLFSKLEDEEYKRAVDKRARNAANAPNRRVVVFFFRPGTEIDVQKWPCPRTSEGTAGCRKRFWSDAKDRLRLDDEERRNYEVRHDTFACRFYDRFARRSPCEAGYKEWVIQLLQSGPGALNDRKPLVGVSYVLSGAGAADVRGVTDANGLVRARVKSDSATMTLTLPGAVLTLRGGDLLAIDSEEEEMQAIKDRLYNLGYGPFARRAWKDDETTYRRALKQFQKDHGLAESGVADADTKRKLKEIHGS